MRSVSHGQKGAVNYMTAVVMLLICTLVTGYILSDTVLGTRMSANGLSSERVAAAARAGLAEGLARLADRAPSLPADFSGAVAEQGTYRVRYAWRRQIVPQVLDVIAEARGPNADGLARTVVQSAVFVPWLNDAPPVPVIARGAVRVEADAVLVGADPSAPLIWAGSGVVAPAAFKGRYEDRDSKLRAIDAAGWFEAVFSATTARVRDLARRMPCTICDLSKSAPPARMFLVQGGTGSVSLLMSDTAGAANGPSIAVIEGDLELVAPLAFEGLLFVTGSVVIDHPSVSIKGAVVSAGGVTIRSGSITYVPRVFGALQQRGYFAPLPGSRHELIAGG